MYFYIFFYFILFLFTCFYFFYVDPQKCNKWTQMRMKKNFSRTRRYCCATSRMLLLKLNLRLEKMKENFLREKKTLKGSRRMVFKKRRRMKKKRKKSRSWDTNEFPLILSRCTWNVLLEGIIKYRTFCMGVDDFWLHSWNTSP